MKKLTLITLIIISQLTLANTERRIALVLGNGEYQYENLPKLDNAINDAKDLTVKLKQLGFDVIRGIDMTKKEMIAKIVEFDEKIRAGNAEDTVALLFYAGHGMEVDGKNYLIPINANISYQEEVEFESVQLARIQKSMERSNSRLNLIILDACRNNPLPSTGRSAAKSSGWGAINSTAKGTFIAFGTSPGKQALDLGDRGGRNGLFTKHILKNLDKAGASLETIFKDVRDGVWQDSIEIKKEAPQLTWQNNATIGTFYFVPPSENTAQASIQQTTINRPNTFDYTSQQQAGKTYKDCSDCPTMVVIPAGTFQMGSNKYDSEKPIHEVNIKQFSMSQTEVTFNQWDACYNDGGCSHKPDDQGWGRGNRPVINVSWNDAQDYIKWLNNKTGKRYRLPSEAEWEYAARAGSTTKYSWGDSIGSNKANCNGCGSQWDYSETAPVKSFAKNSFGLYDMHGNVWEWVEDIWHNNYKGAPSNGSAWTSGRSSFRLLCGGSWFSSADTLRSANCGNSTQTYRSFNSGFRLAQDK